MKRLNYTLKELCRHNKDGSYQTQADRKRILSLIADTLDSLGFKKMSATSLKQKHSLALFKHWHSEGVSVGTIKNRMACLRWWASKINKPGVVFKTNEEYFKASNLEVQRRSHQKENKAWELTKAHLEKVEDDYTALSLRLRYEFGLRREESIKFIVSDADQGDRIALKGSWAKGGKDRTIPVLHQSQRQLLDDISKKSGKRSLISLDLNYKQQLNHNNNIIKKANLKFCHGLRHAYAQRRYLELTGWLCPKAGGPSRRELTSDQREVDNRARKAITKELGHGRLDVLYNYIGT